MLSDRGLTYQPFGTLPKPQDICGCVAAIDIYLVSEIERPRGGAVTSIFCDVDSSPLAHHPALGTCM